MAIRNWYIAQALESVARLNRVLLELTEEELLECLSLESQSSRRKSITNRLISRAVRLNELQYASKLKTQYLVHPAQQT